MLSTIIKSLSTRSIYKVLRTNQSGYLYHSIRYESSSQYIHASGQYFLRRSFLFTLPIAFRSIASTTRRMVGTLYGAISSFSWRRRSSRFSGAVCEGFQSVKGRFFVDRDVKSYPRPLLHNGSHPLPPFVVRYAHDGNLLNRVEAQHLALHLQGRHLVAARLD